MAKVRLELSGWENEIPEISSDGGDGLITVNVADPATLHGLFVALADSHPDLVRDLYDLRNGKMNDRISVFLNGEYIAISDTRERKLKDGDRLIFLPVLAGG